MLSGVTILFFALDALGNLLQADPVVLAAPLELGWPASAVIPLGLLVCVGVTLYALPRTSVIGAIYPLHSSAAPSPRNRVGSPIFTHVCSASMWRRSWGWLFVRYPALLTTLTGDRPGLGGTAIVDNLMTRSVGRPSAAGERQSSRSSQPLMAGPCLSRPAGMWPLNLDVS